MTDGQLTSALRETMDAFDGSTEPLTTPEVATRLDLGRRSTYERLDRLVEHGILETKKVGASARVWWQPAPATTEESEPERGGSVDGDGPTAADGTAGDTTVLNGADEPTDDTSELLAVSDAQFDRFVDAVSEYAIFALDPAGHVKSWNAGAEQIKGYAADEIIGDHVGTFYTDEDVADGVPERNLEAAVRLGSIEDEGWRVRADGSQFWATVTITAISDADGTIQGFTKVTRDMTDRRAYERQLEDHAAIVERERDELERELDAVFDRISDGVYGLDEDNRLTYANEQAKALLGIEDDSIGDPLDGVITMPDRFESALEEARSSQKPVVEEEEDYEPSDGWYEYTIYPSDSGLSVYVRDVSARKHREQQLRRRVEQQEVLARLGQRGLAERDVDELLADATTLVSETLDSEYCKVLDLQEDGDALRLRQGVGWNEGIVGNATVSATEDDSQAAYTLRTEEPIVVGELDEETRFSGPALLTDHDVVSGVSVVIGPAADPWGILGVHDTDPRSFSKNDAHFVQTVAAILASAINRHEDERELIEQRERLEALNNLNEVVRDITDAIIDQSTRDEIEATVVDRLAAADTYEFAWVGDVDVDTQQLSLRVESGVDGYLDGTTISIDPDDERSHGPTGRALRTGAIQVSQNVTEDDAYTPWHDRAESYDFQSSAAIPIVHEETIYGVLNIYANRPYAFAAGERDVVAQIGEVIGHAIAATERKQALMSDQVVEVEFHLPDVFDTLDTAIGMEGEARVEHVAALPDEEFLIYGTATPSAVESLEALADAAPEWDDLIIRRTGESVRFEARLTEPTILSLIASRGGFIDEAVIADGDIGLTVQLSPHVDVRAFVDAMTEAYPAIDLLSRRQRARGPSNSAHGETYPTAALTDQQQSSIEAAYYAGFFEWPRLVSGEDVAESLGIAPSTFHQHLRKAESKVVGSVLTGSA